MKRKPKTLLAVLLTMILAVSLITPAFAEDEEPTWTKVASMSSARQNFSSVVLNGKIYVFGGNATTATKEVEEYNPITNSWTTMAPMPDIRSSSEVGVVAGKVYIVGGSDSKGRTNIVNIYDPTSNTWSSTSCNLGRTIHQVSVVDDKLYIIGGSDSSGNYTNTVEMYDPSTNTWTSKAPMSIARADFKSVVLNGKIYAIGGSVKSGGCNTVEVYDPSTDTWTTKAPMNYARYNHEAVVLNNKIYVVGGRFLTTASKTITITPTNTVEVYNPATDTWTKKASLNDARYAHSLVVANGSIFCLGGIGEGGVYYNTVEQYYPDINAWAKRASMAEKRSWCEVAVVDNFIYAIGGAGGRATNTVEKYAFLSSSPTPLPTTPFSLTATAGDSKVDLSWGAVTGATGYNVYRSTTSGGPYTKIAEGITDTGDTDSDVTSGTTYYYVATAVTADGESGYSNEASATPNKTATGSAILGIYMVDGTQKEYDLSMDKVNEFITWCDQRAAGTGKFYFIFEHTYNKGPYSTRNDYIIFDKIRDFEVNQYN